MRGYRTGDNPARWQGHLDNVLPARGSIRKLRHHPALDYKDIPAFVAELRDRKWVSARALEFLVLTAARTGAVAGTRRDEIDFEQKICALPPERAQAKISGDQPRRIPLTDRAIVILKELPTEEGESKCRVLDGATSQAPQSPIQNSFRTDRDSCICAKFVYSEKSIFAGVFKVVDGADFRARGGSDH